MTINVGGLIESFGANQRSLFSFRTSANLRVIDAHTLRFAFSRAYRAPNALEKSADWSYLATNLSPLYDGNDSAYFYRRARSGQGVGAEKIESAEIGYLGKDASQWCRWDIKLFRDQLTSLIPGQVNVLTYSPSNQDHAVVRGAETEVRAGMLAGSDGLAPRHHDPEDYVRRTVRRAGIDLAINGQASKASLRTGQRAQPKG